MKTIIVKLTFKYFIQNEKVHINVLLLLDAFGIGCFVCYDVLFNTVKRVVLRTIKC